MNVRRRNKCADEYLIASRTGRESYLVGGRGGSREPASYPPSCGRSKQLTIWAKNASVDIDRNEKGHFRSAAARLVEPAYDVGVAAALRAESHPRHGRQPDGGSGALAKVLQPPLFSIPWLHLRLPLHLWHHRERHQYHRTHQAMDAYGCQYHSQRHRYLRYWHHGLLFHLRSARSTNTVSIPIARFYIILPNCFLPAPNAKRNVSARLFYLLLPF